jgi:hypothetical protein
MRRTTAHHSAPQRITAHHGAAIFAVLIKYLYWLRKNCEALIINVNTCNFIYSAAKIAAPIKNMKKNYRKS